MNKSHLNQKDKQAIAGFQNKLDEMRQRLGISERGAVLYRADLSYGDDEVVLVEADGFGGGVLRIIEGNYPMDYLNREEYRYSTEAEAVKAAESHYSSKGGRNIRA